MANESFFHVGIVVPQLEPALAELTSLIGLTWRPTLETDIVVRQAHAGDITAGDTTVHLRFVYSNESPHLEVIEAVPGTPWTVSEGSNLHHIGFWTDDLGVDSDRLVGGRCPIEASLVDPEAAGPSGFTYHRGVGIRIELVERAAAPFLVG